MMWYTISIGVSCAIAILSKKQVERVLYDENGHTIRGWTAKRRFMMAVFAPTFMLSMLYATLSTIFLLHHWLVT